MGQTPKSMLLSLDAIRAGIMQAMECDERLPIEQPRTDSATMFEVFGRDSGQQETKTMTKKLLVTGSSGLIGSEYAFTLLRTGGRSRASMPNQRANFFGAEGDTRWNQQRLAVTNSISGIARRFWRFSKGCDQMPSFTPRLSPVTTSCYTIWSLDFGALYKSHQLMRR
jgi:hypothetical protein